MNPSDWLRQQVPGFGALNEVEQQAILHFALLWSLFEAMTLDKNASSSGILDLVHNRHAEGRLDASAFKGQVAYFRSRYFSGGKFTELFPGLNLRKNDHKQLVELVISGQNDNDPDVVSALLIIVYRLRNNLFHGHKWAYGIRGQRANFENANEALMSAVSQFG